MGHGPASPSPTFPPSCVSFAKPAPRTGLTVNCSLDPRQYPKGITLTAAQLSQISLYRHAVLPNWNYTILPNENRN